jgi:hypothetical protein
MWSQQAMVGDVVVGALLTWAERQGDCCTLNIASCYWYLIFYGN